MSVITKILKTKIQVLTKQNRLMLLSNHAVCGKKKSTFIKNKELSNDYIKMNKIINKSLPNGDKFMPELHLKQLVFTYSACGPFTEHQKLRETGNLKHLCRNKLDKACFAHDSAYSDSSNLAKRTISGKILKDRGYELAGDPRYDGYHRALPSMVYKFFAKKTGSGGIVNEQLAEELHKPVTKKFKRRKAYARYKDNIWAADLAEMELLSSKNKNVKYFLCVIDVFTKYAWVKPLKHKKGKTILNAFIEIVNESNRKPNDLWVDQGI